MQHAIGKFIELKISLLISSLIITLPNIEIFEILRQKFEDIQISSLKVALKYLYFDQKLSLQNIEKRTIMTNTIHLIIQLKVIFVMTHHQILIFAT